MPNYSLFLVFSLDPVGKAIYLFLGISNPLVGLSIRLVSHSHTHGASHHIDRASGTSAIVDDVVREVDEELREAALRGGVVTEDRGKRGVAQGFG